MSDQLKGPGAEAEEIDPVTRKIVLERLAAADDEQHPLRGKLWRKSAKPSSIPCRVDGLLTDMDRSDI
jgi:hypothetical protein